MNGPLSLRLTMVGGALMFLVGVVSSLGYLLFATVGSNSEDRAAQMALLTPLWVGLMGGAWLVYHARNALAHRESHPLTLRPPSVWWAVLGVSVWLGLGALASATASMAFPVLFLVAAAAPVIVVIATAVQRLAAPISWRRASTAFLSGALVATPLAYLLEIIAMLAIAVAIGLAFLPAMVLDKAAVSVMDAFLKHPAVGFALTFLAAVVVAPFVEEALKPVGLFILGRQRITGERQAFLVGALAGAGFAIVENMLYESGAARVGGAAWLVVVALRGLVAALHPLATGLVAVGWYRSRPGQRRPLWEGYLAAVGLHALWNFTVVSLTTLALVGAYLPRWRDTYLGLVTLLLVASVVALGLLLRLILRHLTQRLATQAPVAANVDQPGRGESQVEWGTWSASSTDAAAAALPTPQPTHSGQLLPTVTPSYPVDWPSGW